MPKQPLMMVCCVALHAAFPRWDSNYDADSVSLSFLDAGLVAISSFVIDSD